MKTTSSLAALAGALALMGTQAAAAADQNAKPAQTVPAKAAAKKAAEGACGEGKCQTCCKRQSRRSQMRCRQKQSGRRQMRGRQKSRP